MARKVELGAGLAATVLGVLGLLILLLAPLLCVADAAGRCPAHGARYVSLLASGPDAGVWIFLLALLLVLLTGAGGAIAEARFGLRAGAMPLWAGALMAFMGCAFAANGVVGLFFLPGVLALAIAAYASLLQRLRLRPRPDAAPPAPPIDAFQQHP